MLKKSESEVQKFSALSTHFRDLSVGSLATKLRRLDKTFNIASLTIHVASMADFNVPRYGISWIIKHAKYKRFLKDKYADVSLDEEEDEGQKFPAFRTHFRGLSIELSATRLLRLDKTSNKAGLTAHIIAWSPSMRLSLAFPA